jgi:chitin disaccharide deacetylase
MSVARRVAITLAIASTAAFGTAGQGYTAAGPESGSNLVQRLGYDKGARLLIVHADDVGASHAINLATFDALASGLVTSASVMVPCAGLQEVADYAARHPEADFGLHLTLTSDDAHDRWGPVAPKAEVPSLVDSQGYFLPGPREALVKIDPKEVEIELRAQLRRAKARGLRPTHLDSHQLLFFFRPALFETYVRVGRDAGLPVLLARGLFSLMRERMAGRAPNYESLLGPHDAVLEDLISMTPEEASAGREAFYESAVKNLRPGVSEIIIHVAYEAEVPPDRRGDDPFGSAWRQKDFDYFTGPKFRALLRQQDIHLISWRDLASSRPAH